MSARPLVLGTALVLGLTGCPSIQSVQTAETVGEGNFQFAVEPGVIGVAATDADFPVVVPTINLSARFGVSERVDIGGRFGTSLIELHGKFMFTDPLDPGAVHVAFAPQLGGIFLAAGGESVSYGWLNAPILVDVPVGDHDVVLGPRVHTTFLGASGSGVSGGGAIVSVGSSVGFAARVGSNARVLPEFSLVVPVVATGGGESFFLGEGAVYTFNVGILLGGRPLKGD